MVAIWIAVGVVAAVGAVAALALAVADRYLAVQEDPRIGLVTAALPGANCGGCGFAGCNDYVNAMVEGRAKPGLCPSMNKITLAKVSEILGVVRSEEHTSELQSRE